MTGLLLNVKVNNGGSCHVCTSMKSYEHMGVSQGKTRRVG